MVLFRVLVAAQSKHVGYKKDHNFDYHHLSRSNQAIGFGALGKVYGPGPRA